MLVLCRKHGEQIHIADNIEVKVISMQGGRVRLGISAPDNITINRSEARQRLTRQQTTGDEPAAMSGRPIEALIGCH